MDQVIQVIGAALILAAYIAAQLKRLDPQSRSYLGLNLAGSLILAVLAAAGSQWGFLLLEGVWAIVSFWALVNVSRARRGQASGSAE